MVDEDTVWIGVGSLARSFEIARDLGLYIYAVEGFSCDRRFLVPHLDAIIQLNGTLNYAIPGDAKSGDGSTEVNQHPVGGSLTIKWDPLPGTWQEVVAENTRILLGCVEALEETDASFFEFMMLDESSMRA